MLHRWLLIPFLLTTALLLGAPQVSPVAAAPDGPDQQAADLEMLINDFRSAEGLNALRVEARLQSTADGHSQDLAMHKQCSHIGNDGRGPLDRLMDSGYPDPYGEVVACGQTTAAEAFDALQRSTRHREIMLCTSCREMGVALASGSGRWGTYWVVNFGNSSPFAADEFYRVPAPLPPTVR